jgi:hypothetical protein
VFGTKFAAVLAALLLIALSSAARAQSYSPPPSDFTAYWEEPAFADFPYLGPDHAKGVILWSHGVSGRDPEWPYPPPDVIKDFARAGWDVVKLQRNNLHEAGWTVSGTRHVARLVGRIGQAHDDGYQRIIAAGQSYGGAISLEAAARTDLLFGVMAFAPGHGSDACGRMGGFSTWRMSDNLPDMLAGAVTAERAARAVVVLADGDECQGHNEPSPLIHAALGHTGRSFIHLDASMPVRGHLAAMTEQFRRWYGPCLIAYLDPGHAVANGETRCAAPAPAPRFLLPADYRPPAASPDRPDGLAGAWSGDYVSPATSADYNRDVCVVIEPAKDGEISALTAFGAGMDKRLSMVTFERRFERDGAAFVYRGNAAYRMALAPDPRKDALDLAITSINGKVTWKGVLKRGC